MAGRRRSRGAYNFTMKRRAALRRAQMISARKRRRNARNAAVTVGVLAGAGVIAYGGYKYGPGVKEGVAKQVTSFKPRMANMRNRAAAFMAVDPKVKEAVQIANAVSRPAKSGEQRHPPVAVAPNPRRVYRGPAKPVTTQITENDRINAQAIRDALREELGLTTVGGNAAKRQEDRGFNDDLWQSIKEGPLQGLEKTIAGSKTGTISERTARRHIGIQSATLVAAGGKAFSKKEVSDRIKLLRSMGIIASKAVTGKTASRRKVRRRLPKTGPASSQVQWTDSQMASAFAMEY